MEVELDLLALEVVHQRQPVAHQPRRQEPQAHLLLAAPPTEAARLAERLEALNRTRRTLTERAMASLRSELAGRDLGPAVRLEPYGLYAVGVWLLVPE